MLALLWGLFFPINTVAAPAPEVSVETTVEVENTFPDVAQVAWLHALEQCESKGNPTARVLDVNGYYSYGILQFQMATFIGFSKEYGTDSGDIYDPTSQETLALKMLDDGLWKHWYNCSQKVIADRGYFPAKQKAAP